MVLNKTELTDKINLSLNELRPHLVADGGDMELVDITDEGIVQVRLLGACSDCSMSMMTIKAGLEEAVKRVAPEIIAVEAVN
ncbi:NifU family protein [Fluviicola taffensis]|uniref:Nitrogen-fixing NifU domain-containing protein n=1 Tax=Fluviicola taffensis (strain DSM 16823 / NCIMB 13979 / RW262) TaxID=755732 RepID=F2IK18_FLUTR|nr:NifU family protein [Fluviicola taffensis]AEA42917.1 nitrogen-fixing NifU domain-containing protein [Fluviicola taffensis DSM 16823]